MALVAGKPAQDSGVAWWSTLSTDPIVRLQGVVLLAVAIPYFVPAFTGEQLWYWSSVAELPLLVVTLLGFRLGLARLQRAAERRFWNLWSLALGAWLVKTVAMIVAEALEALTLGFEMAVNGLFFVFYLLAAMALESRPNLPASAFARALRAVERLGTFVFFIGLFLYLVVVPAVLDLTAYLTTGLLFYLVLDLYLIIRLTGFLRGTLDASWLRSYAWLLVTAVLWFATDALEVLIWAGPLAWLEEIPAADVLWLSPWLPLVVAARVRHLPSPIRTDEQQASEFPLGPLVVFTVAVPIVHFACGRAGLVSAETRPVLEILALAMLLVLAILVVIRQELLRGETRRLEAQRARDLEHIEHLAFHDPLTGVPNRRLMEDRLDVGLDRASRFERRLAVLLLDLDNFKTVNDTLGHDVGDEVLRKVARRIEQCVRGGDTVARFGGDEFVAVVEGLRRVEDASRVLTALREALARPFKVGDHSLHVAASIGMATYPDDARTSEELLKEADVDMYRRKRAQTRNGEAHSGGSRRRT